MLKPPIYASHQIIAQFLNNVHVIVFSDNDVQLALFGVSLEFKQAKTLSLGTTILCKQNERPATPLALQILICMMPLISFHSK